MHLLLPGWTFATHYFQTAPISLLDSLQLMQNAAAHVLTRTGIREHIIPVLASLHWLPVKYRIESKILLFTFKALNERTYSSLLSN